MIEPFIMLRGQAAEALDYYEKVFDGTNKRIVRWGDAPPEPDYPVDETKKNWVMTGSIELHGTTVSISDWDRDYRISYFVSLLLHCETPEELIRLCDALQDGGRVWMKPDSKFDVQLYAWVQDRYGVSWHLICA